jgi:hypothetical protein
VAYVAAGLLIPGAAVAYGLLPASAATAGPITGLGGKCVDVAAASTANGTAIQLCDCNGTNAQTRTVGDDDSIRGLAAPPAGDVNLDTVSACAGRSSMSPAASSWAAEEGRRHAARLGSSSLNWLG